MTFRSRVWASIDRCARWGVAAVLAVNGSIVAAQTIQWQPMNEPGFGTAANSVQVSPHDATRVFATGTNSGVFYSTDSGLTWRAGTGLPSGHAMELTFHPTDPNVLWVGTSQGPYKSTDAGRTWVAKNNGVLRPNYSFPLPVQEVLYDPNNASTLLAFAAHDPSSTTGSVAYCWVSTDGGETWTRRSSTGGTLVRDAAYAAGAASTTIYAVTGTAIVKSTNDGTTWASISPAVGSSVLPTAVAVHPTDPNTLWISCYGLFGVFKSVNGGASWVQSTTGLPTIAAGTFGHIVVCESNPSVLYVSRFEQTDNANTQPLYGVYKSIDGGASWAKVLGYQTTLRTAYPRNGEFGRVEVAPANSNLVFAAVSKSLAVSRDAGATWQDAGGSPMSGWYGNGLVGSTPQRFFHHPYATGVMLLTTTQHTWVRTLDTEWRLASGIAGATDITFSQSNPSLLYATAGEGATARLLKSTDGGLTWTALPLPPNDPNAGTYFAYGVYVHPTQSHRLWASLGRRLVYTENDGATWQPISSVSSPGWIYADKSNPLRIYVTVLGGVYKSEDGLTFAQMTGSPRAELSHWMRLAIDPSDPNRLYAASLFFGVYRYTPADGWTLINSDRNASDISVHPTDSARVSFITSPMYGGARDGTGIWTTTNALGATPAWAGQNGGLPVLGGNEIEYSPDGKLLIAGIQGRGFWRLGQTSPSSPDGQPFGGSPRAIPGRIQAEDFNTGGANVAYVDTTPGDRGLGYRTGEDVDLEPTSDTGGGFNLGWTAPGEWLKYTVNVQTAGTYRLRVRYAGKAQGSVRFEFGGVDKSGAVSLPSTKGYQTWKDKTIDVNLSAGVQTLKFNIIASGFNINYFELTPVSSPPPPPPTGNGAVYVEAEAATARGSGWNVVSDGGASGGAYLVANAGMSSTSAPTNGTPVATYVLSNLPAGTYKLWGRVKCANPEQDSFWVRVDNGSWINWNNIPKSSTAWKWDDVHNSSNSGKVPTFTLTAGSHTIEVAYRENGGKLDRLYFTKNGDKPQ